MGYKQFVKRLFPYLKNHLWKLAFVSVLMIFATALEASIPEITGRIIDNLFSAQRSPDSALFFSI
ncbi:ABC transporter, partial [Candidatus Thioglobus sp.]|nr:ABC transporter [Candidatus Thioglobus sp.]